MSLWIELLPSFAVGLQESLLLAATAAIIALPLGCLVGIGRVLPVISIQKLAGLYINIVRSTPLPVIFVFFFFALPDVGIHLSPFYCAAVGLGLYMAAYVAEALRSGINGIPSNYIEAARALGLSERVVVGNILLPQALRAVIPTIGNLTVDLIRSEEHTSE